jgi:hypothetical protein
MATPWPGDHDAFQAVRMDLAPLLEAYPDGEFFVPEGLEGLLDEPLANGVATAVPWVYVATTTTQVRLRGEPISRTIEIHGVTITQGVGDDAVFRRYVDWAGVWAQLGISSGRGELPDEQHFLGPDGRERGA